MINLSHRVTNKSRYNKILGGIRLIMKDTNEVTNVTNDRIIFLKQQYKDKSLSKIKRHKIHQEILKERYKLDERKSIKLYDYRLISFWANFLLFIAEVLRVIYNAIWMEKSTIVLSTILLARIILIFPLIGFLILKIVIPIDRKVEIEDEMAIQNMNKAHKVISRVVLCVLAIIMIAMFFIDNYIGVNISLTLNASNIYSFAAIVLFGYFTLESGLFLWYEGKEILYDESEEDECLNL